MLCPHCKFKNHDGHFRCAECHYGIACPPKPPKRRPSYLGDTGIESHDEFLGRTYVCSACQSHGGSNERVHLPSINGEGGSGTEWLLISCKFCGLAQLFHSSVTDKYISGWPSRKAD